MNNNFVFLDEALHGVRWDAKYATWDNFTGKPVDGYELNRIVATTHLCQALESVKLKAFTLELGLLVWDSYRPQRAVNCFMQWAQKADNDERKNKNYPNISRCEMFEKGYVAEKSSHSRGGAVDLTLYNLKTGALLEMGTDFDLMDKISHHGAKGLSKQAASNRNLLKSLMESSGFEAYQFEWWHYVLKNEPFPSTYFDFLIA